LELLLRLSFRLFRKSPPAFKRLVGLVVVAGAVTMIVAAVLGHGLTLAVQGSVLVVLAGVVGGRMRRNPHIRYRGPIGWIR
jgi:hypothetical protein